MLENNKKSGILTATGMVLALSAGVASAQTSSPDVSSVTAVLTAAAAAGATIGVAYLAMKAGIKLYAWIRAAL